VINIGASDLISGSPTLVLGLVWQIIKIQLLSQISLRNVPELVLLLKEDETMVRGGRVTVSFEERFGV
jgi:hypothetical protein